MLAFAAEFDPQPMHLDEEAASRSMLQGLSGSGWHLCSIMMRMMVDGFVGRSASLGSPGVTELRWLAPFRPDDQLTLDIDVVEARVSRSRPETGLVTFKCVVRNAAGLALCEMVSPIILARRAGSRRAGGLMRFFEDIEVGQRRELGSFTFTADLIKTFARQFDPQRFHLDEEEGRKSLFGGLAASGWHVGRCA
jgi:Acyl dehydratase